MSMTSNNRVLTPEEFKTLVKSAHTNSFRYGFTVYLLGRTGIHRGEAAHFGPNWFDTDNRRVIIPPEQGSWKPKAPQCERVIPLSPPVAHNIEEYIDALDRKAFGVFESTISRRVTSAADIDDLPRVTPPQLRQMYAVALEKFGVPEPVMAAILGLPTEFVRIGESVTRKVKNDGHQAVFDERWASTEPDLFGTFPDKFRDES